MKHLFLLMLLALLPACAAVPKASDQFSTYRFGPLSIVQYTSPCMHEEVLNKIKDEARQHFRAAVASAEGKDYVGCWRASEEEKTTLIVLENGTVILLQLLIMPGVAA